MRLPTVTRVQEVDTRPALWWYHVESPALQSLNNPCGSTSAFPPLNTPKDYRDLLLSGGYFQVLFPLLRFG
jgi:hypothetical protein